MPKIESFGKKKIESFGIAEVKYKYDLGCVFVFYGGKMTAKVSKEDS